MKKRVLASLLASTMLLGGLVSCSSGDSGSSSSSDSTSGSSNSNSGSSSSSDSAPATVEGDPVTIGMLFCDGAAIPYQPEWPVWEWILEGSNVIIDVMAVQSADFNDKRNIMLASGDVPEIIAHSFPDSNDISAGLLLPISQYEDQMPNYQAYLEANGLRTEMDSKRAADGEYYYIPVKSHPDPVQDVQWVIRTDVFEEHNLPIPTTMDEVYEVCLQLKELYPNFTIPNRFGANTILGHVGSGFGVLSGGFVGNGMKYDYDSQEWFFSCDTEEYRMYLEFVNKMYHAGILDAEFATMDSVVYEQKIIQGDALVIVDWATNIPRYEVQAQSENPDFNLCAIFPPSGVEGEYALGWKSFNTQAMYFPASLADDEEALNAVLAFIDWGYTEEAEILLTFGIEGETFYIDDGGIYRWMEDNIDYQAQYGVNNNNFNFRQHVDSIYAAVDDDVSDVMREVNSSGAIKVPNPSNPLTMDQLEETQIISGNIADFISVSTERFIYNASGISDADWDAYVEELNSKGVDKILDAYDTATGGAVRRN